MRTAANTSEKQLGLVTGASALDRWRLGRNMTFDALGIALRVSKATAYRLCRKGMIPSREVMGRIAAVTGGAVTAADMFEPVGRVA